MALFSEPEMIPTLILLFCLIFQKTALELFLLRFLWWLNIPSKERGRGAAKRELPAISQRMLFSKNVVPLPELELCLHEVLAYTSLFLYRFQSQ